MSVGSFIGPLQHTELRHGGGPVIAPKNCSLKPLGTFTKPYSIPAASSTLLDPNAFPDPEPVERAGNEIKEPYVFEMASGAWFNCLIRQKMKCLAAHGEEKNNGCS